MLNLDRCRRRGFRTVSASDFNLKFTHPNANALAAAERQASGLAVGMCLEDRFDIGGRHPPAKHFMLQRGIDFGLMRLPKVVGDKVNGEAHHGCRLGG